MDINDTRAVIAALKDASKSGEAWRVEQFTMYRASSTHGHQEVAVRVLDSGASSSPRYHVSAVAGSKKCTGNSGDDLDVVIRTVHWYELDK
ncbi:hypothetical protein [uncultured Brachybacterium sp.]|uniref:hypothetical protein n=1 Tax=uncultured Brachybacterium sp. TaxID=189680 RepID=UPI00261D61A9|nr:hypothetical protein [uncultured Brachybacterium sp.]